MKHYAQPITHEKKSDHSPVTLADTESDALIVGQLQAFTPQLPVVSEEGAQPSGHARYWLVDPLDGTRSYIARDDEFSVNIALIDGGEPVLGVLAIPAKGLLYWAEKGGKAYRQREGKAAEAISCRTIPPEGMTVATSKNHGSKRMEAFLAGFGIQDSGFRIQSPQLRAELPTAQGAAHSVGFGAAAPFKKEPPLPLGEVAERSDAGEGDFPRHTIAHRIPAGSAYKFALVAEGTADFYPRLSATMEWDTAAGHCIVEAAGGRVTLLDGSPLRYGKAGFLNPEFLVWGTPLSND